MESKYQVGQTVNYKQDREGRGQIVKVDGYWYTIEIEGEGGRTVTVDEDHIWPSR